MNANMKTPRTLLAVLFAAGLPLAICEMRAQSSQAASPAPVNASPSAASLTANPNPVAGGTVPGKTTITWETGAVAAGDVYVLIDGKETLFASGPKGSQEAPWIKPGTTEFRLYNADHKLLAQLTVTMPSAKASASSPSATPVSSPKPR
jgi:hypothetical protein